MKASLLACLSIELLNRSYEIAYVMAATSMLIVLASFVLEFRRKKFSWTVVYVPLLILQPGWRLAWGEIRSHGLRAMSADCGFGNRGESIILTILLLAVLIALVRGRLSKRVFLFRLTIVCWIFHVLVFFGLRISSSLYLFLLKVLPSGADEVEGTISGGDANLRGFTLISTIVFAVLYVIERIPRRRGE